MRKYKKRTFLEPRELPPDFARDYVTALRALSRKHKDDAEAKKGTNLLRRMSKESFLAGRGEVWIPSPDRLTGHYPVMENVPYKKVRTAIRKNTKRRKKAWDAVASSTRPFLPLHSTVSHIEKSLLPAVITAVPFKKGRHPALLGKKVPGELKMLRSGAQTGTKSLIPIKSMSPEEWTQRGFQPLKFSLQRYAALGAVARKRSAIRNLLRGLKKAKIQGTRRWKRVKDKLADSLLENPFGAAIEEAIVGKKGEVTKKEARSIIKKIAGERAARVARVSKHTRSAYVPHRRRIVTRPHAAPVAHEATHARQHQVLGKAFVPLYGAASSAAPLVTAVSAARRSALPKEQRGSVWKPMAKGAALFSPQWGLEAHAGLKALRHAGGKRALAATMGTYTPSMLKQIGVAAGIGHLLGAKAKKEKKVYGLKGPATVAALLATAGAVPWGIWRMGHRRALKERVGLKKELGIPGKLVRLGALGPLYLGGRYTGLKRKEIPKKWIAKAKAKEAKGGVHFLDAAVYEKGFQYGLRASWQRKKIGAFLKKHAALAGTAMAGSLVGGGLAKMHTEFGIPPTTVDLSPVQRTALRREFQPYPSTQLRGFRNSLMVQLDKAVDVPTAEAVKKQIGKINVELIQRGSPLLVQGKGV